MSRSINWTPEDDQVLIENWYPDGYDAVARLLWHRSEGACISRVAELRRQGHYIRSRPSSRPRKVRSTRKCLHCGRKFGSEGPFNRLCLDCKASPMFRGGSLAE